MTIQEIRKQLGVTEEEMSDEEIRTKYGGLIDGEPSDDDGSEAEEDEELERAAVAMADRIYQHETGNGEVQDPPDVNPSAGEEDGEEGSGAEGFPSRHTKRQNRSVTLQRDYLESEGAMALNTLRMIDAYYRRDVRARNEAFHQLARGGHYGEVVQNNIQTRANDYYNTLVGDEGGILLPTSVRNEIDRIAENVGAFRQFARVVPNLIGKTRFPAASSGLKADAIQEGGDIKIDRRSLQGVNLDPTKWAKAIAWTLEAENEQIAQEILDDAQEAVADGFARAEDDAGLNGDGTSTHNNITGILQLSGTATYTLATGNTTFASITASDLALAKNSLPSGVIQGSTGKAFIFNETMEAIFQTMEDTEGNYLFQNAYNGEPDPAELWGIPVFYTEELPATTDGSQADTDFGVLAIRRHWIMGTAGMMTTSTLSEATLKDQNDNDVRLGSQDLTASVFREWFDIQTNFPESAVVFHTAAS